jgi:nucleoside-specific outer membrane channel protein Tsx
MISKNQTGAVKALAWGLATAASIAAAPASAGGFAAPDIQVLYGKDYGDFFGTGVEQGKAFPMFTIELANGWTYGDNFFFSDINQGPQYDTSKSISTYSEIHSRLSGGKISGKDVSFGPVSDVLLAAEIDLPSGVQPTYCAGVGLDFGIPGFAFAFVNVFMRDEVATDGVSFQINPVWNLPVTIGPVKAIFTGWIDVMSGEGKDQDWWWQAQPTLFLDVANFWGVPNKLLAGCEYEYFHNFLGINQGDVNHPQFVMQWNL